VFFFQAEDGIRDRNVTGVQTCALPILVYRRHNTSIRFHYGYNYCFSLYVYPTYWYILLAGCSTKDCLGNVSCFCYRYFDGTSPRSEERRVGRGGRSASSGGDR